MVYFKILNYPIVSKKMAINNTLMKKEIICKNIL